AETPCNTLDPRHNHPTTQRDFWRYRSLPERMKVMGKRSRYYLSVGVLSASLMLAAPRAAAQDSHAHDHAGAVPDAPADTPASAVRTVRWSDPAAWPDGKVPGEGAAVTIPRDLDVTLDVDPPALRSLTIDGKLRFSDERDLALETEW